MLWLFITGNFHLIFLVHRWPQVNWNPEKQNGGNGRKWKCQIRRLLHLVSCRLCVDSFSFLPTNTSVPVHYHLTFLSNPPITLHELPWPRPSFTLCLCTSQRPCGYAYLWQVFTSSDRCVRSLSSQAPWRQKSSQVMFWSIAAWKESHNYGIHWPR
jgi:hypothetical protein